MRVAIIADVQGNAEALRAILSVLDALDTRAVLALGDLTGRGPEPHRVVRMVRDRGIVTIRGDWDDWVGHGAQLEGHPNRTEWIRSARSLTTADDRVFLLTGPRTRRVELDGHTVLLTHKSELERADRLGADASDEQRHAAVAELDADVIAIGPGRRGFVRRAGDKLVLAPGSAGYPVDGDPRPACALITFEAGSTPRAELLRVPYPIRKTARAVRRQHKRGLVSGALSLRHARACLAKGSEPRPPLVAEDSDSTLVVKLLSRHTSGVYRRATGRWPDDDDVEHVHDIRVSSRRLRAALQMAEPLLPPRRTQRALERLRELGRTLGRRRSADVILARLEQIEATTEAGVDTALLARAKRLVQLRRRRATRRLRDRYPPERLARHGLDIVGLMMQPRVPAPSFAAATRQNLLRRIRAAERYLPSIEDPNDAEGQHRLRVMLKRLRYACELTGDAFWELRRGDTVATVKRMQDALGELNDDRELAAFIGSRRVCRRADPEAARRLADQLTQTCASRYEAARDVVRAGWAQIRDELRPAVQRLS